MLIQSLIPLHWIKKVIVNINYLAYFNNETYLFYHDI